MTPEEFKEWRVGLKLSQSEAAKALGLHVNSIYLYERGERDGRPVVIPLTVELATQAVTEMFEQ